jgi:hypothetical protein
MEAWRNVIAVDAYGKPTRKARILADITERKKTKEDCEKARQNNAFSPNTPATYSGSWK